MNDGFRHIDLTDPEWGEVRLLVSLPRGKELWGVLSPLRGTKWGDQVQVVPGKALSHALHGWATPLMQVIGPAPRLRAKKVPYPCALIKSCTGASPHCRPGSDVPECYEGPEKEMGELVSTLVMAWKEGRYVIVVEGPEFSF